MDTNIPGNDHALNKLRELIDFGNAPYACADIHANKPVLDVLKTTSCVGVKVGILINLDTCDV